MNVVAIIPARYASSRFPGKPLALINGKPMIWHVYWRTKQAIEQVYVATDDERIFKTVENFGGKAIMTDKNHRSGTERVAQALSILEKKHKIDIVINVQGDEPLISPKLINQLVQAFNDPKTQIATAIRKEINPDDLFDPNTVKVIPNHQNFAIYFSRSPIPYLRDVPNYLWTQRFNFWHHIGIYAYKASILQQIVKLPPAPIEQAEQLEQLRWIYYGYKIKLIETDYISVAVDIPADIQKVEKILQNEQQSNI